MSGHVTGKNKNDILKEMVNTAQPGSPVHEQQKMGILVRATEDVESALNNATQSLNLLNQSLCSHADSSTNLARKVFWLNVVLAIATVVGAGIALLDLLIRPD